MRLIMILKNVFFLKKILTLENIYFSSIKIVNYQTHFKNTLNKNTIKHIFKLHLTMVLKNFFGIFNKI